MGRARPGAVCGLGRARPGTLCGLGRARPGAVRAGAPSGPPAPFPPLPVPGA